MANEPNLPPGMADRFLEGEAVLALWVEYRGIGDDDLSRRTGIEIGDLRRYLSGAWRPTAVEARLLACALGIEVTDVVQTWDESSGTNEQPLFDLGPAAGLTSKL